MDKLLIIFSVLALVKCKSINNNLQFPNDFMFGVASAAYQIEGAWNESDKAPSVWDDYVHKHPEKIVDRSTADVTSDSYHKYKEDIKILEDLKVNHYRFSLSWSRILPKGDLSYVNKDGLRYYDNLLDELKKRNITPFVTIYHWDHPQILETYGGWLNEGMIYAFADYAKFVFTYFGNRIKHFVTINEPEAYCAVAYTYGLFPPAIQLNGTGDYNCMHNMLKAHALAYHIYNDEFRSKYNGKIGTVMHCNFPYSNSTFDSDLAYEFECGWVANPIYSKTGDYPEIMKKQIAERSRAQGYNISRLPTFSKDWIEKIRGTADFLGINYYTSHIITSLPKSSMLNWPDDTGYNRTFDHNWASTQTWWLKIVPEGLGSLLRLVRDKYDNPLVYILENGMPDGNGTNDVMRISYLQDHLKVVLSAMNDGCNVKGYTVWSLLDSFEWVAGYTNHFGLVQVDYKDENRTRTPKKSAIWYKNLIRTRKIPPVN